MRTLASFVFLSSLVVAQETATSPVGPDLLRFLPRDAVLIVRSKGLGSYGETFAKTGVGKLVAAGALARPWQQLVDELENEEALLEDVDPKKITAVLGAFAAHRGELAAGLAIDCGPMFDGEPPELLVSFAMTGEAEELDRLTAAITEVLPGDGADRTIGGEPTKLHAIGEYQLTAPLRRDGAIVMLLGNDLEQQAAKCLEPHPPIGLVPVVATAAFGLQCEVETIVQHVLERLQKSDAPEQDRIAKAITQLGGAAVRRVWTTFAPDGPWVGQSGGVEFAGGTRGLVDCFLPASKTSPRMVQLVPPGANNWNVSVFDFEALHRCYVQGFELIGDDAPMSREEFEAKFTEFTKLRLHDDVIALLGSEYLRVDDFVETGELEEDADERVTAFDQRWGDSCYAIALRDGKTMAQNVEKALRSRGLHAARKTEEYGGVKIHRLKLLGAIAIEYAFAGDVLVYGIGNGEGTARNLRGVLDAVAARQKGERAPELPAPLRERLQGIDEDWTTIDVATFTDVIDGFVGAAGSLEALLAEEDVDMPEMRSFLALAKFASALRAELVRHRAETTVTVGRFRSDACVWRSRW